MGKEEGTTPTGPEKINDNFRVVMKYNPEFVYTVLNRGYKSHVMPLYNNWDAISEEGYDLFTGRYLGGIVVSPGIETVIDCDLKVKSQPDWPDRSTKSFNIRTNLWLPSSHNEWRFLAPRIQTELLSLGLDFDLTGKPDKDREISKKFLISRNLNLMTEITHWGDTTFYYSGQGSHYVPGIQIKLPFPSIDLTSPRDIKECLDVLADTLEKTIRALYKIEKKHLPLQSLVFEPLESESTEKSNLVSCTYCGSNYSIVHGLTCPHCGASKPHFS